MRPAAKADPLLYSIPVNPRGNLWLDKPREKSCKTISEHNCSFCWGMLFCHTFYVVLSRVKWNGNSMNHSAAEANQLIIICGMTAVQLQSRVRTNKRVPWNQLIQLAWHCNNHTLVNDWPTRVMALQQPHISQWLTHPRHGTATTH